MKQGDIYIVTLDPTVGHEQSKTRPCVVLQCNSLNSFMGTVIVAPITSAIPDKAYPNIVFLDLTCGLQKMSVVKVEQMRSVDKSRLLERIGKVSVSQKNQLAKAISSVFQI